MLFLGEVLIIINIFDLVFLEWLEEIVKKEKEFYVDYVVFDLLKLLG